MKLLRKQEIVLKKNDERKKEIDEGVKLAKTVDVLRQTLGKEQANLAKFRTETLKSIQLDIDNKIKERDELGGQINTLKEELEKKKRKLQEINKII